MVHRGAHYEQAFNKDHPLRANLHNSADCPAHLTTLEIPLAASTLDITAEITTAKQLAEQTGDAVRSRRAAASRARLTICQQPKIVRLTGVLNFVSATSITPPNKFPTKLIEIQFGTSQNDYVTVSLSDPLLTRLEFDLPISNEFRPAIRLDNIYIGRTQLYTRKDTTMRLDTTSLSTLRTARPMPQEQECEIRPQEWRL
jgi:hypothetical protein